MPTRVSAQNAADSRGSYLLGTATTGGTYHPVGVALSTLIKLKLLPELGIDLTAINTDGSRQNLDLLRQGDVEFAIISALAGNDARSGAGEFAPVGPDENLRAITTLWLSSDHLLIRKDAVKSGTIDDFLALRGRPVSLGREDSSTLLENRTLMSAFGVDIDSDFSLLELSYAESAEALASGQIDGMSVSGGVPIGAVQDVYEALGGDAALLEINDEQLALIDEGRGLWQRVVIPSGTYPGQDRDIFTIGTPNILAVRADVDEDVVYQITRTIFEELEYLHGLHNTTRQISLDNAVNSLPLPIHAGAERYFREKGVELPLPPLRLDPDLLTRYPTVEVAREATNRGVVSMFAGTEGDTSTRIAAELAAVLDVEGEGVRLLATNGGGIGRNLTDLLYLRGVDTALVRADTLNYARNQGSYPAFGSAINYISEMFPEEVHLLVRSDIADLNDLTGKTINIGAPGTGADITASIILSQLGVRAEVTAFEPRMAIEKLKQGEIAGAFLVGGKPMPLLREIDPSADLKLIALPNIEYFDSYFAAEITGDSYPNLMQPADVVPTIAVRTALLTYAWRPGSSRYEALGDLARGLFDNLLTLQNDGYHQKWREVDPSATFVGWQRFQPAEIWIDDNEGTARRIASEGRVWLEERKVNRSEANETAPLAIENEVDGVFVPDDEIDRPAEDSSAATLPTADGTSDTALVPTAPVVDISPDEADPSEVEPAAGGPLTSGAAALNSPSTPNGTGAAGIVTPKPAFSNAPTAGSNAPTF